MHKQMKNEHANEKSERSNKKANPLWACFYSIGGMDWLNKINIIN